MPPRDVDLTPLVIDKNRALHESLINLYTLTRLDPEGDNPWRVNLMKPVPIIYAGIHEDNSASFTHELLHIKNSGDPYYNPRYWITFIESHKSNEVPDAFASVEFRKFMEESYNVMMHPIILPEFLRMRFDVSEFVYDYNDKPDDANQLNVVNFSDHEVVNFGRMCDFIYFCCKVKFHPNNQVADHAWKLYIDRFGNAHSGLYEPVNELCEEWMNSKIANNGEFFKQIITIADTWAGNRTYYNCQYQQRMF